MATPSGGYVALINRRTTGEAAQALQQRGVAPVLAYDIVNEARMATPAFRRAALGHSAAPLAFPLVDEAGRWTPEMQTWLEM